jgi:hypothetical protein
MQRMSSEKHRASAPAQSDDRDSSPMRAAAPTLTELTEDATQEDYMRAYATLALAFHAERGPLLRWTQRVDAKLDRAGGSRAVSSRAFVAMMTIQMLVSLLSLVLALSNHH